MEMTNGDIETIEQQMLNLKEKDSSFAQMINFIETKIDAQIQTYNNTKTKKERFPNDAIVNFTIPNFAMTPAQRQNFYNYFENKSFVEVRGSKLRVNKCFFGRKIKFTNKKSFIDVVVDLILFLTEDNPWVVDDEVENEKEE